MKTNIKMRVTPEQSRKVQEICFENGIEWKTNKKNISNLQYNWLFIYNDCIRYGGCIEYFERHLSKEISADLFIKTNGICEEDNGNHYNCKCVPPEMNEEIYLTKYTSQPKDLESALKKIENLHMALKKKVEKNKNQALEITKLLEQKKEYKEKIDMVLKALNNSFNNNLKELQSNLDYKNECERQLRDDKIKLLDENRMFKDKNSFQVHKIENLEAQNDSKDTIISYLEGKLR